MNKLSSSVLHLAATAAIATSGDVLANTNDTTTARIVNTKSPEYVNVTETTKKRIADLQKNFPQFKIDPEVLSCIKNELIDAECEPTTIAVADAGENMIKIEAKKLELLELTKRSKELDKEKEEISKEKEEISKKNAELDKEKEEISKEKEEISKKNAELVTMNKI